MSTDEQNRVSPDAPTTCVMSGQVMHWDDERWVHPSGKGCSLKKHPAMWQWMRIFWISFLPLLIISLIIPNDWPEIVQWAPTMAVWYIRGRVDQQYSFTEYAIKEVRKAARDMHKF